MDGMVLGRPTETGASIAMFTQQTSLHKELASVRVLSSIRHREEEGLVVFEREVFVVEGSTVDRLSAGAVPIGEVARLNHEVFHDTMEHDALEI
jgi:hypothetical protein